MSDRCTHKLDAETQCELLEGHLGAHKNAKALWTNDGSCRPEAWTIRDEFRHAADGGDRFTVLNTLGNPVAMFPTRVLAEEYITSLCRFAKERGTSDPVNHPAHYTFGGIEVIDAIEAWSLNYHLGNVVKYVARARHKGDEKQDLLKARWYLERALKNLEKSMRQR